MEVIHWTTGSLRSNDGIGDENGTNKHLGNSDYFVIIASSWHRLLLTENAANGLQVEAWLKIFMLSFGR